MKPFLITTISILFLATLNLVQAQEAAPQETEYGWKKSVLGNLNLTQASFDNWEAGGESTLAWQVKIETKFINEQEKYNWKSSSKFTLGFAKVGDQESRKSADEIFVESVYTRKIGKLLNPFVSATAQSQFVSGFEYTDDQSKTKISKFLNPGYFTQSIGVGYTRDANFTSRLGATLKETITNETIFATRYSDDPDTPKIEKARIEQGITSVTEFQKNFQDNVIFSSKLNLFTDLEAFDRIDVLWENNVTFKISKIFNVSLDADLLYDKDISSEKQIKQILSIGLTYSFL